MNNNDNISFPRGNINLIEEKIPVIINKHKSSV